MASMRGTPHGSSSGGGGGGSGGGSGGHISGSGGDSGGGGAGSISFADLFANAKARMQRRLHGLQGMSGAEESSEAFAWATMRSTRPVADTDTWTARLTRGNEDDDDDHTLLHRLKGAPREGYGGMKRSNTASDLFSSPPNQFDNGVDYINDNGDNDNDSGGGGGGGGGGGSRGSPPRRRSMGYQQPWNMPSLLPAMPPMLTPPNLPEWDVFKSLKTNAQQQSQPQQRRGGRRKSRRQVYDEGGAVQADPGFSQLTPFDPALAFKR